MNRLRAYFADQQALKAQRRLQSDIVREYREDIVGLIANDGARLAEVAAAVRAQGEPVLEPGFKAEILKQIGKTKDIRAGKVKGASSSEATGTTPLPSMPTAPVSVAQIIPTDATSKLVDDDEDLFSARCPRA